MNILTLDVAQLDQALRATMTIVANEAVSRFEKTVSQWRSENRPKFGVVTDEREGDLVLVAGVLPGQENQEQVFRWVTRGTAPHDITPKRAPMLVFNSPYFASTSPRQFTSRPVQRGGTTNFRLHVKHPGARAREFEEQAAFEIDTDFWYKLALTQRTFLG